QKEKQEREDGILGSVERLRQRGRHLGAGAAPGELRGVHPRLQPAPHREAEGGHLHQGQPDLPEQCPETDLQVHQQQLLQGRPQSASGRQGARGQEQPAVCRQPEVPEEPRARPGRPQEHGPGPVGHQDPCAQEPHQEQDRGGRLSGREPREAGPRGAGAGGHGGPRGGGREAGRGPTGPRGRAGADGEPAPDTPVGAAGIRPRDRSHGHGAGREWERVGSWILSPDSSVKNPPASVGDESSAPKGGHGSPPQHASLESPTDRGAWWAAVHGVAESQLLTTGSGGKGLRRHLNGPRSPPHEHFQSKQGPRRKRATSREGHVKSSGTSPFMDALTANGTTTLQTSVTGVTAGKRKFIEDRRDQPFDKRLRFSVRQTESAYRYRDIVVRKQDGFTHILLSTKSSENNSLNPEVMKELQSALSTAAADDSKLVLLSAVGSVFCCGLDFIYFIRRLTDDRKRESARMAEAIRNFVNTFIQFKKPIIVAVNGPAIGLGASILPLCDVVWANEKAWFQTPYTTFGQSPDGCSTVMFPRIMGGASANEMLLSGRKLTAQEACGKGLVSQVFWPGTFTQEVMVRIKELASCNPVVLEESKALVRCNMRLELEQANERECEVLKKIWGSAQGMDSMLKYLQRKIDEF
uniref:Chromodomain Y like n=2 Tax=Bovidae TaxID=9895 RepID=A0A8C2Y442_CAPHI